MDLHDLGYTNKWFLHHILTKEILAIQLAAFRTGEDTNTEHYRYGTLVNWIGNKTSFTNEEILHFLALAQEDEDNIMAGSAVKALITSPKISTHQFELIKAPFAAFGAWTKRVIEREIERRYSSS